MPARRAELRIASRDGIDPSRVAFPGEVGSCSLQEEQMSLRRSVEAIN